MRKTDKGRRSAKRTKHKGNKRMPVVRVKPKFQVTLPSSLRKKTHIAIGDIFEVDADGDTITLKAKRLVDRHIAEGLADLEAGRVSDAFDSAEEMMRDLEEEYNIKRRRPRR